jgi:hypothetical protein
MPKIGLVQETELETRTKWTKVKASLNLIVEGTELPNMAVLGDALEEAVILIQKKITDSYKVVPPRTDTPIAAPYENKADART